MITENQQQSQMFAFHDKLDGQSIMKYTASNLSFCHKLFNVFLKTIPQSLEALDKAIEEKDYVNIHANTHKIKSNFKIVGLDNITVQLSELEKISTDQNPNSISLYNSIKPEITNAMTLLNEETVRLSEYLSSKDIS